MPYAKNTRVPVYKTQHEIRKVLADYGCTGFAYAQDEDSAAFRFSYDGISYNIGLPLHGSAQEVASRWRALLISIKGRLALAEADGSPFEEVFYPHILLPSGGTVYEVTEDEVLYRAKQTPDAFRALVRRVPGVAVEVIALGAGNHD